MTKMTRRVKTMLSADDDYYFKVHCKDIVNVLLNPNSFSLPPLRLNEEDVKSVVGCNGLLSEKCFVQEQEQDGYQDQIRLMTGLDVIQRMKKKYFVQHHHAKKKSAKRKQTMFSPEDYNVDKTSLVRTSDSKLKITLFKKNI